MISILIITHYSLGDSYRQIMKHFFGESISEDLVIGSNALDTQDSLLPKIKQAIQKIPEDQPVLILTDIF
ncbi:MAG: PTS mannose transporter subunit IIA, partial [Neisseriaceae bacterium]|nr:PTS mannose transporter subunit IIA [Neisseriaceae bacterium]